MVTNKYALRSSAVRAAKKAGLEGGRFEVVQVDEGEGRSHWEWKAVDAGAAKEATESSGPVAPPVPTAQGQPAPAPVATPDAKRDNIRAAKSTVANPVQVVHKLVAEMLAKDPKVRRKDLVAAAIKTGCAYYTARTQVQVALKKMKANRA
jgi:hypothetical protein